MSTPDNPELKLVKVRPAYSAGPGMLGLHLAEIAIATPRLSIIEHGVKPAEALVRLISRIDEAQDRLSAARREAQEMVGRIETEDKAEATEQGQ